jgi:VanZ family protein
LVASCATAVGIGAGIFILTQQPPDVTSSQSNFVNDFLAAIFGESSPHHDAAHGLWFGIHIRHWAHVVEFGALGLAVATASALAFGVSPTRRVLKSAGVALAICAGCSLFDQTHKLFVPARHFDVVDLGMDALGYVSATALVLVIAKLASLASGKHVSAADQSHRLPAQRTDAQKPTRHHQGASPAKTAQTAKPRKLPSSLAKRKSLTGATEPTTRGENPLKGRY